MRTPSPGPGVRKAVRVPVDSGLLVVIIIITMYMAIVFGLLFYIKNDWCDLLYKNFTVTWAMISTVTCCSGEPRVPATLPLQGWHRGGGIEIYTYYGS
jgi:hypothetical protein